MNASEKDRPPLNYMGPYNVARSDLPDFVTDTWAESDDLRELSDDEFLAVRDGVVTALSKHGNVYGGTESEHDFFVYDDKFFDRTQKVELNLTQRLPRILPGAVRDLQQVLVKHSLWRVMLVGDGAAADEECLVVYPDVVRMHESCRGSSLMEAVSRNASLRLRNLQRRRAHQKRRKGLLRERVRAALATFPVSRGDAFLVAWFDTLSALDYEWGYEGMPGTSVWVLVRDHLPEAHTDLIESEFESSVWWALPDGSVVAEPPNASAENVSQLVHFRSDRPVGCHVSFKLRGQLIHLTRSQQGLV